MDSVIACIAERDRWLVREAFLRADGRWRSAGAARAQANYYERLLADLKREHHARSHLRNLMRALLP